MTSLAYNPALIPAANISDPTQVDYRIAAWQRMNCSWDVVSALVGGTEAMRLKRTTYLPQETHEKDEMYETRLKRSFLYGAYRDTIDKLASKPFSKLVTVEGVADDDWLKTLERNVDKCGCTLTQFAYDMFKDGVNYGLSHALVDYPKVANPESVTQEDVQTMDLRPVWRLVDPRSVIGWRWYPHPDTGQAIITDLRIYSCVMEPDGPYGEQQVEIVDHWTTDSVRRWKKYDGDWVADELIPHAFGQVPLYTFYTNKTDVMEASPPMMDLAQLNVAHWISDSDHRNILRFARCGILFASGVSAEEFENGIKIGPAAFVASTNKEADLRFVEYSGGAIPYGMEDAKSLENRMMVLGLQPVIEQSKYATAAGRTYDEVRAHSRLQQWVNSLAETLGDMMRRSVELMDESADTDEVKVLVSYDAALGKMEETVRNLVALRQAGEITRDVLALMLKRCGLIPDDVDLDEMVKELDREDQRREAELKREQAQATSKPGGAQQAA